LRSPHDLPPFPTRRSSDLCALDGEPDMAKGLLQVLVPASTPGVETVGKWNTLGMRATFSPSVKLNRCLVGKDAALGTPGAATTVDRKSTRLNSSHVAISYA